MLRRFGLIVAMLLALAPPADAAERRVALVVGTANYKNAPRLANTLNDANAMAGAMARVGFEVETLLDPDRAALEAAVRRLGQRAQGAEASLFYYAGHAIEVGGRNWLIPVSAELPDDRSLRFEALEMDAVLEQTQGRAHVSLLILDACRDNPFRIRITAATRALTRGLEHVEAAVGSFIAFATAPGMVADDGNGPNSPFTAALLKHIETPGLEVRQMMTRVRRDVRTATNGRQIPWDTSVLEGDFYFRPQVADTQRPLPEPPRPAADTEVDVTFWKSVENSKERADLQAYLNKFPNGIFAELARACLTRMPEPGPSPPAPKPPTPTPASSDPLALRLAAVLPKSTPSARDDLAKSFRGFKDHKALAAVPGASGWWWVSGYASGTDVATKALESCQFNFNTPCTLVVVDDNVLPAPANGPETTRDMARVRYRGSFDPMQIPLLEPNDLKQPDIANYKAATGAKAAAMHVTGRFVAATKAPDQRTAEETALAECNRDRKGNNSPCYLYAAQDRVVLPMRLTAPRPTATTVADALLLVVTNDRVAESYRSDREHKALALELDGARTFKFSGAADRPAAEQFALEFCQIRWNMPCVLVASDDELKAPDPTTTPRRASPRMSYTGPYKLDMVPLFSNRQTKELVDYATLHGPKAMAIGAVPLRARIASGTNDRDAETKALAACNDPPDAPIPCILYAVNDRVILPQRRTEPSQ
jgi:Caspase domain